MSKQRARNDTRHRRNIQAARCAYCTQWATVQIEGLWACNKHRAKLVKRQHERKRTNDE